MSSSLKEIIKIWREEELKSVPKEHPDKTPFCLPFARIMNFVKGTVELNSADNLHIQDCPYCKKVEVMFRRKFEEKSSERVEEQEIIGGVDIKPDLSILDENEVCFIASQVLRDLLGDKAPQPEDLILNFRIGREQDSLFDFEFEEYETVGEGIGGFTFELTTTTIINLVAILIWTYLSRGQQYLSDSNIYLQLREDLLKKSGNVEKIVSTAIDKVRKRILDSL